MGRTYGLTRAERHWRRRRERIDWLRGREVEGDQGGGGGEDQRCRSAAADAGGRRHRAPARMSGGRTDGRSKIGLSRMPNVEPAKAAANQTQP